MSTAAVPSALLDADAVAEILGIPRHTIWLMVRRGELPALKIGRRVRFRREVIERWLSERETEVLSDVSAGDG